MYQPSFRAALAIAVFGLISSTSADEAFETPPVFQASQVLPAKWVTGRYHKVAPKVRNDGKMNHYAVESKFGAVTAASTAELRIRIDEMAAMAAMQRVSETGQFSR